MIIYCVLAQRFPRKQGLLICSYALVIIPRREPQVGLFFRLSGLEVERLSNSTGYYRKSSQLVARFIIGVPLILSNQFLNELWDGTQGPAGLEWFIGLHSQEHAHAFVPMGQ